MGTPVNGKNNSEAAVCLFESGCEGEIEPGARSSSPSSLNGRVHENFGAAKAEGVPFSASAKKVDESRERSWLSRMSTAVKHWGHKDKPSDLRSPSIQKGRPGKKENESGLLRNGELNGSSVKSWPKSAESQASSSRRPGSRREQIQSFSREEEEKGESRLSHPLSLKNTKTDSIDEIDERDEIGQKIKVLSVNPYGQNIGVELDLDKDFVSYVAPGDGSVGPVIKQSQLQNSKQSFVMSRDTSRHGELSRNRRNEKNDLDNLKPSSSAPQPAGGFLGGDFSLDEEKERSGAVRGKEGEIRSSSVPQQRGGVMGSQLSGSIGDGLGPDLNSSDLSATRSRSKAFVADERSRSAGHAPKRSWAESISSFLFQRDRPSVSVNQPSEVDASPNFYEQFKELVKKDHAAYASALMDLCKDSEVKIDPKVVKYLKFKKWLDPNGQPVNPEQLKVYAVSACRENLKEYIQSKHDKLKGRTFMIVANLVNDEPCDWEEDEERLILTELSLYYLITDKGSFVSKEAMKRVLEEGLM